MNFSKKNHEHFSLIKMMVSKVKLTLFMLFVSVTLIAQNGINYKAVIKDTNGNVVANQGIDIVFSIQHENVSIYSELQQIVTDNNGIAIATIGDGSAITGTFDSIDWKLRHLELNIQIDFDDGDGLVDFGNTQFNTVPYAINTLKPQGLEAIDEGDGIGWRLANQESIFHEDIGLNAIDLSISNSGLMAYGASGDYAVAMGLQSLASGNNSAAIGLNTIASGDFTFASGVHSNASGNRSIAIGSFAIASGTHSISIGSATAADDDNAVAIGNSVTASGSGSVALGTNVIALGTFSTAMGFDTEASETYSMAMGRETLASGDNSTAIGRNTEASGISSTAMGQETEATGDYSTAMGRETLALGENSTALGIGTRAVGENSTAIGEYTNARGQTSLSVGRNTNADGDYSFTTGRSTYADADYAVATGYQTDADGLYSFTTGFSTEAVGDGSFSAGNDTSAIGNNSFAMGLETSANGNNSAAFGYNSNALGLRSFAAGSNTLARAYMSFAIGRWNRSSLGSTDTWIENEELFIIGNGTSSTNRSSAMTVLKNGNVGIGTSLPQEALHVWGRLSIYDETIEDTGSNQLSFGASLIPDSNNSYRLGNSSSRWIGVWATDGTINTSDRRDKTNIKTIDYGLNEVLKMNPVSYNWKNRKHQGTKLGLIAQDLLKLVPEVVKTHEWQTTSDDKNAPLEKVELNRLGMYYSDLIPVLINAIKEQNTIIKNQGNALKTSKNNYEALLSRIEQLEANSSN